MERAVDIVEKIMHNKENYEEYGLHFPEKGKKWQAFNLLVGENGSGKSRILKMIKEKSKEECTVIYLDFSNYVQLPYKIEEDPANIEDKTLVDNLIFREEVEKDIFLDFVWCLDNQILYIFDELLGMENDDNSRVRGRVKRILNDLSPSIQDILHREIEVKKDGIYLCKGNRKVAITDEWKLLSPGERSILVLVLAVLIIKLVNTPPHFVKHFFIEK